MLRLVGIFSIVLAAFPALCQSTSKYQVGTITEVKIHQTAEKVGVSDAASYDVSVRVGDAIGRRTQNTTNSTMMWAGFRAGGR